MKCFHRYVLGLLLILAGISSVHAQKKIPQLILEGEDIDGMLLLVEKFSGKTILRHQSMQPVSITFESRKEMTIEEALIVVESLLALNGVALMDLGDNFLKAVPSNISQTQVPNLLTEPPSSLPPSQQVYAYIYKLNYMKATEAEPMIKRFLANTPGDVLPLASVNSLLVTDPLINLQRVEDVLAKLDKPIEMTEEVYFHSLKHVTAEDMLSSLREMQEGSLGDYWKGNVNFDADERTNQLIIITPAGNLPMLKGIIEKLDINVDPRTKSDVISVSNAEATKVADLINEIITGQEQNRERSGNNNRANNNNANNQANNRANNNNNNRATTSRSSEGDSNLAFSEFVKIVADERSNAIVATGTESDLKQIRELITKIDVLLAQVKIQVVIAEVTLGDDQVRGIESFGIDASAFENWSLIDLQGPSSGSLSSPFSINSTYKDFTLGTVFSTAKRKSDVSILSAPTIVTTHNQEASITVAESRPLVGSTTTTDSGTVSSVNFEDIGITLKVTPLIGANGVIQMELEQTIDKVIDTTQIDNNEQPIIGSREAKSFLSVRDGSIIVLGGLQELEESEGNGRIFFFGEIPIIGEIFSNRTYTKTVRELILFIKPTIIRQPENAHAIAHKQIDDLSRGEDIKKQLKNWNMSLEAPESAPVGRTIFQRNSKAQPQ